MNVKKLHYFSGLILTIFVGAHLFNHFMSLLGALAHIKCMETLRVIYRNPVVEVILLMAVLVQIISGLKLFFIKRKTANSFFERLHVWSGAYLAFFLIIHLSAVMTGRLILGVDTNIYFGAEGLNVFPLYFFFVPYYGFSILAFFGHIAAIHHQKMKHVVLGFSVEKQSKLILIFGIITVFAIFYGLTDGFTGLQMPIRQ